MISVYEFRGTVKELDEVIHRIEEVGNDLDGKTNEINFIFIFYPHVDTYEGYNDEIYIFTGIHGF